MTRTLQVVDEDDVIKLTSFTGEPAWTTGNGYIPMTIQTDHQSKPVDIDIEDADRFAGTQATLLSLVKLVNSNWKFDLGPEGLYAYLPDGERVTLVSRDNVLYLPHITRTNEAAKQNGIHNVSRQPEYATSKFFHKLFNHANAEKVNKTLDFSEETEYEVYNAYGQLALEGSGASVDVTNLNKGTYYVNYGNHTGEAFRKR